MQYVNSGVLQLTGDFMAQVLKGKRDATGRLLIPMKSKPFYQLENLLEVISPLRVCQPPESMEADRPPKEKSLPGGFQVACECMRTYGTTLRQAFSRQLRRYVAQQGPRETWWCNEHVGEVITAKRQAFKA